MWTDFFFSFIATISYGILFSVPRKAILGGGLIGMSGWIIVQVLIHRFHFSDIASVLIASFVVASISQLVAKRMKMPSTNFSIAGVIPLVPGALAYRTMRSFVAEDYLTGLALATETLLSAGAIAAGIMFSLSIFFAGKGTGWRHGAKHS
jgi:uncharacterized membrane protein YjjB (DUF3815 family)